LFPFLFLEPVTFSEGFPIPEEPFRTFTLGDGISRAGMRKVFEFLQFLLVWCVARGLGWLPRPVAR
jgi:hypothetical protein